MTIPQVVTATTLQAAPNPAFAGQPVTLTATVEPAPTRTPAGTVSFFNGATLLGTGTVDSSGIATFTTSSLPTGIVESHRRLFRQHQKCGIDFGRPERDRQPADRHCDRARSLAQSIHRGSNRSL